MLVKKVTRKERNEDEQMFLDLILFARKVQTSYQL